MQKSRDNIIRHGDRNTRFFHLSTIIRRKRNNIDCLKNDSGSWVTNTTEVQQLVVNYYHKLFSEPETIRRACLQPNLFPKLKEQTLALLNMPFSSQDIFAALKSMGPFKAPGPDGYQPIFFQHYWGTVGQATCDLVLGVLRGASFPEGLNDTFLTLIPKVDNPETIKQFRPIGLCNVVYKLVTKSIGERLKVALKELIAPTQVSFVPQRQITDNVVIMHEALHSMKRKSGKVGIMAVKLDLEKAYDRLNWKFIRETLLDMGIPTFMVEVIMLCVTSARLQILWNGSPSEQFLPTRGIRQGDPLSPYLFVACIERLSHMIEVAIETKKWKPLKVCRNGPAISHLMFADDVVLFAEASVEQATTINSFLDKFCSASGQLVSSAKSRVFFSSNTPEEVREAICNTINMEETTDLGPYLGIPSISRRTTHETFKYVLDRVEQKLSGWRTLCLNLAGRVTLIKSTLSTIPSYTMQTMMLPRSICDRIDKHTRRFLWGGSGDVRKVHLVAWRDVTKPVDLGGLGIRSMRQLNSASLAKLGWRFLNEPDSFWARVLKHKYCKGEKGIKHIAAKPSSSLIWRGIARSKEIMAAGLHMGVGNGLGTDFWYSRWCDSKPLIESVISPVEPRLLQHRVVDMWTPTRGWKVEDFADFLPSEAIEKILSCEVSADPNLDDCIYWGPSKSGLFTLNSAIRLIRHEPIEADSYSWKTIWQINTPQRYKVLLWLLSQDRLMTNCNRAKRKFTNYKFCQVCGADEEDAQHLFWECSEAAHIWQYFSSVNAPRPDECTDLAHWIMCNIQSTRGDSDWPGKFCIIVWWLWRWRNMACFNNHDEITGDKISFLLKEFHTIKIALAGDNVHGIRNSNGRQETLISWDPPSTGWVRLNTDGAAKGNPGLAGGGGVFRNEHGNWLFGYAEKFGRCSSVKAELKAILRGLRIAREKKITHLEIHSDSKTVVQLLREGHHIVGENMILVYQCTQLIQFPNWEVTVSHCYREINGVADALANLGITIGIDFIFYERPPSEVLSRLFSDNVRATWPRMIAF